MRGSQKLKIAWIVRKFQTTEVLSLLNLWKQRVLCDFCSQLWNPDRVGEIQSLELLQLLFITKMRGMQHLSDWDQLKSLSLCSIERRRKRRQCPQHIGRPNQILLKYHPRRGKFFHVWNVLLFDELHWASTDLSFSTAYPSTWWIKPEFCWQVQGNAWPILRLSSWSASDPGVHQVKPTAQLVFKNRFPKDGPTCRRQVVNPRHQTSQGQSVAKPETPLQNIQVE